MARSTVTDDLNTALSEQFRVLMVAEILDSDLDMAYQLQMEEAMNASIALQPSTSTSQAQLNYALSSPDDDDDDEDDDLSDFAVELMLQDVEWFAQELEDRELSEAEMRKMLEDLDRRIHDQKLAEDIQNIPEQDWEVDGDNYHRPYRTDLSSSSSSSSLSGLLDTECFRLYFKGLVSEESVRGMKVTVAGAGVAICDPRDNLILEVRKNLEAVVDGQVVTYEVAELEALIEGLNEVLSLDLERLTFFCDDYMLYQYVSLFNF
jgi:hypothetical protein